ncbi:TPR-like protein [Exidia glandulosa HHB12029]|uniref:TPR-like protein n=1 Tax=Exidia glandulosa HHB12029 TaxID=1314781 RepID=A0A165JLG0_EXIGL|nr:TPR-like protein [Exidia glandulosa HHB12029]
MSMQALISGAECATTSNPLSQVLKHAEGDRSIQRVRVTAGPSSSLYRLPPSSSQAPSAADLAAARQFFEQQQQQSRGPALPSFDVERLRNMNMSPGGHATPPPAAVDMAGAWQGAARPTFSPQLTPGGSHAAWASEFELHRQTASPSAQTAEPMYRPSAFMSQRQFQPYMPMQSWTPPVAVSGKGKGRMTDADFDAAFAALSTHSSAKIEEVDELTEGLQDASLQDNDYMSEFQKSWEEVKKNAANNPLSQPAAEELARWEAQFNQLNSESRLDDDLDYDKQLQEAYEQSFNQYDIHEPGVRIGEDGVPDFGAYQFEQDNKYMVEDAQSRSFLAEARDLLANNGSLTEAALLLEAAIQKGDTGKGGYEAWVLLGETRSMDEREEAAMKALAEGTRLAAEAGDPTQGLMSLAISYTNESYERASYNTLLRWLKARYPGVEVPPPSDMQSPWALHAQVQDAFLAVARGQHTSGAAVDPELQIGLGVLFYTDSQFDKAQDCFETALGANPNDYLLWNRLGSCLSNGSKPEEALGAYRQALELRPTYTRAIYNVGVACLNIGAYEEAAKHFLSALAMQETGNGGADGAGNDKSAQLWTTLQRCFTYMNRNDLAEMARKAAPVNSFRLEGFDF